MSEMNWSKEELKNYEGKMVTLVQDGSFFDKDSGPWRDTGILKKVNDGTFELRLTQGKDANTIKARPISIVMDVEIEVEEDE